jgi:phage/conjugal plasmid C-4 type zinc finger TraR family protein
VKQKDRCEDMATGWAREGAVGDQIQDTIDDGVQSARARLPHGDGTLECVDCGEPIPAPRRTALPGVTTCIACQSERDRHVAHATINRRGSKDSQLK